MSTWEKQGLSVSAPAPALSGGGLKGVTSLWSKLPTPTETPPSTSRHKWKATNSNLMVALRPFKKPTAIAVRKHKREQTPKNDGNEWEAAENEVAINFPKLGSGRQYVIEDNAEGTKH